MRYHVMDNGVPITVMGSKIGIKKYAFDTFEEAEKALKDYLGDTISALPNKIFYGEKYYYSPAGDFIVIERRS